MAAFSKHTLLVALLLGAIACKAQNSSPRPATILAPDGAASSLDAGPDTQSGAAEHEAPRGPLEDGPLSPPSFRMPTGSLPSLTCYEAHAIVAQIHGKLPYQPTTVDQDSFARETATWLDPHGVWAQGADAPVYPALRARAKPLLSELTAKAGECPVALVLAKGLPLWIEKLHQAYREGRSAPLEQALAPKSPSADPNKDPHKDPHQEPNEDVLALQALAGREIPQEGPALQRAKTLGQAVSASLAREPKLGPYAEALEARVFPTLTVEAWQGVLLASALRAWLPLVDGHSSWAPHEEETTLYDIDLDDTVRGRLWKRAQPSLLGATIDGVVSAPLASGDTVLEVDGLRVAGLSAEELDQLAVAPFEAHEEARVTVLHAGKIEERLVRLTPPEEGGASATESGVLQLESIPYGAEQLGLVRIEDVHDSLGQEMGRVISLARSQGLAGLVLDLRGNGGGSMDAALDALGHFLPNVPSCPLKDHEGELAPDMTTAPPEAERWTGPVLALVDRETASAAEILAGSLAAYKRGAIIGTPTFGKGCVQEYMDDDTHRGALRLTSYLYALPNGAPVQRVGLTPDVAFEFPTRSNESEGSSRNTGPSWKGSDVRPKPLASYAAWPKAVGTIGPCKDALVCKALTLASQKTCKDGVRCGVLESSARPTSRVEARRGGAPVPSSDASTHTPSVHAPKGPKARPR
jgi:carboxyl-terminal processing protease